MVLVLQCTLLCFPAWADACRPAPCNSPLAMRLVGHGWPPLCTSACCLAWLTPACPFLQYAFGRVGGLWVVLPSQLIVLIGLGITYTVTGGQSLKRFYAIVCTKNDQGDCTSFVSLWQQPACTRPVCILLCSSSLPRPAHAPCLSGHPTHAF